MPAGNPGKCLIFFGQGSRGRFQIETCFKLERKCSEGELPTGFVGDPRLEREAAHENPNGEAEDAIERECRQQRQNGVGGHGRKEARFHENSIVPRSNFCHPKSARKSGGLKLAR